VNWGQRLLCCWPGLARLWLRGDWVSLGIAVGFTVLLNLAFLGTFVWPELLGPNFSSLIWPVLLLFWMVSYWLSSDAVDRLATETPQIPEKLVEKLDTLFLRAQDEYLKGDWAAAERLLSEQLRIWPRDAEARLMLATLLRHSGRFIESLENLDFLDRIDESLPWSFEIEKERFLVNALQEEMSENAEVAETEVSSELSTEPAIADLHAKTNLPRVA
jgi:tetratricopeptide (TPR) repeat protein